MAVRRLLIVMLILLGISTLLASQVPRETPSDESEDTVTSTAETPATQAEEAAQAKGRLLEPLRITVSDAKIKVIPMRVGDQLPLVVRARTADQVEIPALGLVEPVARGSSANFNILAEEPGNYGIRLLRADRVIGRIEVRKP